MPIVSIPRGARDKAIELSRKAQSGADWDVAYRHGFFEALSTVLPSEVVGLIIMDCDCALGDEPLMTERLPRFTLGDSNAD
jgi:hypothetical protein